MFNFRRTNASIRQSTDLRRRGTAAVEMAMVLPVFVTALLGIIELGRAIMVSQLLENAAREGARMAILDNTTNAQVTTAAQTFMQNAANIAPSKVTVTINVAGSNSAALSTANPGDLISVTVSIPFSSVSWLPPHYLSGVTLKALGAMRHE
jgi:Flp pilus assembly protein TadG